MKPWEQYGQVKNAEKPWESFVPQQKQYNPVQAASLGIAQGLTFGTMDEIMSKLQGGDYESNLERNRAVLEQAQKERPVSYFSGNVGGGLALGSGAGALVKGAGLAGKAAQLYKAAPIRSTAGLGAVQGGLYGAGEGEGGFIERAKSAARGAGLGGLFGGAAGFIGSKVGTGAVKKASQEISDIDRAALGKILESKGMKPTETAISKIADRLKKDYPDPQDLQTALQRYASGEGGLVEYGGVSTAKRAQGAAQYPSGGAKAEEYFEGVSKGVMQPRVGGRMAQAKERVANALDAIAPSGNMTEAIDDILSKGSASARPLYDRAYQSIIPNLQVKPEVASAIEKARSVYPSELEGLPDNSVKVLDYAKKVLDDQIGAAKRSGERGFANSRTQIKNELLSQIDQASPEYTAARKSAGDYLSLESSMKSGYDILKPSFTSDAVGKAVSKMAPKEKEAFRSGMRQALDERIAKIGDGRAVYTIWKDELRNKFSKVLTKDELLKVENQFFAESNLAKLRDRIISGSPTTGKAYEAADIADSAASLIEGVAQRGVKGEGLKQVIDFVGRRFDGINDKTAGLISDLLYETDPSKKLAIIKSLENQTKALSPVQRGRIMALSLKIDEVAKAQRAIKATSAAAPALNAGEQ